MKCSAKRLLSVLVVLAMALSLVQGVVLAAEEEILVAEGSASFATDTAAFNGKSEFFTPETNGTVTVTILSCTPGYYVDLYENDDWLEEHEGAAPGVVSFDVIAGRLYEILMCSYNASIPGLGYAQAGSLSYQITFLSNGESSGGGDEPEDPSLVAGATPENPKAITGSLGDYIGAGQTVWYLYDNRQNMEDNGVYSMMLHISSSADYTVTYAEQDVPVDTDNFVNYEMLDTDKVGTYLFAVTNHSGEEKFFSLEVKERSVYFYTGESLSVGSNKITLDTSYPYTLYEFSPSRTGVYQLRVNQGRIGDWGTPFNPVDNTPNKTNSLIWTCTAVGQTLLVGFTGPAAVSCTVIRTGEYIPDPEIPWTFYENTYDFHYELSSDADVTDVDLTDGGEHIALLGADDFYHYGSAEGPLMVCDLTSVEINISDACSKGGLRAWLQDENGKTISKVDYNEALNAYYNAGLVPVTAELATMLQEVGQANGWWISNGLIFPGDAPADVSAAWMQLCGYLTEAGGAVLTGRVETGASGEVTVELLDGEAIIATVTATEGVYTIQSVAAGTYTLRVSQANHTPRTYAVTMGEDDLVLDVKIHLIGDLDGNGKVNTGDVAKLYGHLRGSDVLTDDYVLLCANVNGGSLNMGDMAGLYAHVKGNIPLF